MPLTQLVQGLLPAAGLILLVDTERHSNKHLLQLFLKGWREASKTVSIVAFESLPEAYNFNPKEETRDFFFDGYSNLLGWEDRKQTKPNLLSLSTEDLGKNFEKFPKVLTDHTKAKACSLLIDSLSSVLLRHRVDHVIKSLQTLKNTKEKFFPILVTIHEDLHNDFTIKSLERIATTIIRVEPPPMGATRHVDGSYSVLQKRKSGKISRILEHYYFDDGRFLTLSDSEVLRTNQSTTRAQKEPMIDVTFNLGLTEAQKKAKDEVVLPYVHRGQGTLGNVYTQEYLDDDEEDDDLDSDPDDDLDI